LCFSPPLCHLHILIRHAILAPHSFANFNMHPTRVLAILLGLGASVTLGVPTARSRQDRHRLLARTSFVSDLPDDASSLAGVSDVNQDAIVLPPIAEVFSLIAASASGSPTSVMEASSAQLAPTQSSTQPVTSPSALPSPSSHEITGDGTHGHHKLVFVGALVLTLVTFIMSIFGFSYSRHRASLSKLSEYQEETRPKSLAVSELTEKARDSIIVHITRNSRNYPRSKFSISSSDYPLSLHRSSSASSSSYSDSNSKMESDNMDSDCDMRERPASDVVVDHRGLMDPAHLFALRASSMAAQRHSRAGSEPTFGVPRFDHGRRDHSRRSRSVSGIREDWL
ncbi:unnamed protein product, partial [Mycena citricolor]